MKTFDLQASVTANEFITRKTVENDGRLRATSSKNARTRMNFILSPLNAHDSEAFVLISIRQVSLLM
jgi:hypothetical protein